MEEQKFSDLIAAIRGGATTEVIIALIDGGADVHAKDNNGKTALMLAAEYNSNPDVITALK